MMSNSTTSSTPVLKQPIVLNLALLIASLCLSLVITELALRSIIPLNPRNPAEFRIPHPVLGWVLKPDASYIYAMPEATVHVVYNSEGWHDIEHTVKKPDGIFRILVLGDSFMEAYSVELNDAFHRRVEELARTAGSNTEVINLGVASYGTLQEYLVYRDIGRLYEPDIVLLGFFVANDVMNNSRELELMLGPERPQSIARPYLDPNESTYLTVTPGDYEGAQRHYTEEQAFLEAKRAELTERLIVLRLARTGIKKLRMIIWGNREDKTEMIYGAGEDLAILGVNYCIEPAEYTRAWDTTERILARLKHDVEANGSKLVVFTVPALEEVNVDQMERVTNLANPERLCLEEAPGHTRLSHLLKKLNIELITLLPLFRRTSEEDGIQLFRLSDQHWNSDGHTLAAEYVFSELDIRGLLPTFGKQE